MGRTALRFYGQGAVGVRLVGALVVAVVAAVAVTVRVDARPSPQAFLRAETASTVELGVVALGSAADVVAVRSESCGVRTEASGFLLDGMVVTNAHVAGAAPTVVAGAPGWQSSVAVVRVAAGVDLALGAVGRSGGLALAVADAAVGDRVVIVARIEGRVRILPARVQAYSEPGGYGGDGVAMLLDPAGGRGFSGGPVLAADGSVVGVARAMDTATGLTVAEPASTVTSWLDQSAFGDASTSCLS